MNEYDWSVMNPRTSRTCYNKKDAFGVEPDTEKWAEQSRIIRHSLGQNIASHVMFWPRPVI